MVRVGPRHPSRRLHGSEKNQAHGAKDRLRAPQDRCAHRIWRRSTYFWIGERRRLVILCLGFWLWAAPVSAQSTSPASASAAPSILPAAEPVDGPVYPVTQFQLEYERPHPGLPPIDELFPVEVPLRRTETGWAATRAGQPVTRLRIDSGPVQDSRFHASALASVSRALLKRVHEEGLLGVFVVPSEQDIDIKTERDLRPEGDTELLIDIWIGRIDDVRTVAEGNRVGNEWRIDNPIHRKIRNYSPLHPTAAGIEGTTDLVDQHELEEYIHRLNRHPGRQVEAALAPSQNADGVTLDYRVYESRPWSAFVQATNTGTERTARWQTRMGYINRQLTNHDDILAIEYLNAGGDAANGIQVSYEAPWFAPKRPSWMKTSGNEPPWLAWADRSQVPWWGLGRLRWQVTGGWTGINSRVLPDGFQGVDQLKTSDWHVGGRFIYNLWQYHNFFLDVFAGGRFRGVQLDNETTGNIGSVTLLVLEAGIEAERNNQYSAFNLGFWAERDAPLGSLADYEAAFDANLGRAATSPRWWTLNFNVGASYFLEPLLFRSRFEDPTTPASSRLSHEIAFGARGQYAFDYRLIPQSSQVIGGLYTVRGFPQGVAVGDTVVMGTTEYRFHIPRSLPIRRKPVDIPLVGDFRVAPQQVYGRPDWDLIFRAFVDAGRSIRNNRQLAVGTELDQTLVGAGVGLELVIRSNLRARIDWARGIYQSVNCDPATPSGQPDLACLSSQNRRIDPSGELYFLFSVVY